MRVFGVGLSKTGTTSLCNALDLLGFSSVHQPEIINVRNGRMRVEWRRSIDRHDAMTDMNVAVSYEALHRLFPSNAFYILTVRDKAAWLESCRKHFTPERSPIVSEDMRVRRLHTFGSQAFDPVAFSTAYDRHVERVTAWARRERVPFLVYDLCGGAGWEPLCAFLDRPVPDVPFPWDNSAPAAAPARAEPSVARTA